MSRFTSAQALMHARAFLPSMFMAQEPIFLRGRSGRKLNVESISFLILMRSIQDHGPAVVHVHFVTSQARILGRVGIER